MQGVDPLCGKQALPFPPQAGFIREQRSSRLAVIAAANGCDSSD
jgi:hypothetical protein